MNRFTRIFLIMLILTSASAVWVYAAGNAKLHAESAGYFTDDTESKLTLTGGVNFDYNGYNFACESAEIEMTKSDDEDVATDLKNATFSNGVNVSTPSGGKLFTESLRLRRSGSSYVFSGGMTYSEGRLRISTPTLTSDSSGNSIKASGGVTISYRSTSGFKGVDGSDHTVVLTCDSLNYDRKNGTIKSEGGAHITYDEFVIDASDLDLSITSGNELGFSALGNVSVKGRGITVNGLNASYDPVAGELRIWNDVVYTRFGDEFVADDVTWFVREEKDRISAKGGGATIDLNDEIEENGEPVDNGEHNG